MGDISQCKLLKEQRVYLKPVWKEKDIINGNSNLWEFYCQKFIKEKVIVLLIQLCVFTGLN